MGCISFLCESNKANSFSFFKKLSPAVSKSSVREQCWCLSRESLMTLFTTEYLTANILPTQLLSVSKDPLRHHIIRKEFTVHVRWSCSKLRWRAVMQLPHTSIDAARIQTVRLTRLQRERHRNHSTQTPGYHLWHETNKDGQRRGETDSLFGSLSVNKRHLWFSFVWFKWD